MDTKPEYKIPNGFDSKLLLSNMKRLPGASIKRHPVPWLELIQQSIGKLSVSMMEDKRANLHSPSWKAKQWQLRASLLGFHYPAGALHPEGPLDITHTLTRPYLIHQASIMRDALVHTAIRWRKATSLFSTSVMSSACLFVSRGDKCATEILKRIHCYICI